MQGGNLIVLLSNINIHYPNNCHDFFNLQRRVSRTRKKSTDSVSSEHGYLDTNFEITSSNYYDDSDEETDEDFLVCNVKTARNIHLINSLCTMKLFLFM